MKEECAWYAIAGVPGMPSGCLLPAVQRKKDSHYLFRATCGMSFLFPFVEKAEHRLEVVQHCSV